VRGVRDTPVTPPSPQQPVQPSKKAVCIGCGIRLATHEFRIKNTGTWNPVCRTCMSIGLANPGTDAHGNPREYDWRCIRPGRRKAPNSDLYDFIKKSMVESLQVAEDKAIIVGQVNTIQEDDLGITVGSTLGEKFWQENKAAIMAEERIAMRVTKPESFVNISIVP
jgi:hypothetical protein